MSKLRHSVGRYALGNTSDAWIWSRAVGRVRVESGGVVTESVLAGSTLLGRDERCDIVISARCVPIYWLEIRWRNATWVWRPLGNSASTTVGAGRQLDDGWRTLEVTREGNSRRLRCGVDVTVQLIDNAPPTQFGRNLASGRFLTDEEVGDVLQDAASICVSRHQVVGLNKQNEAVLVNLPEIPQDTDSVGVDLADAACSIDLDTRTLTAVLTLRNVETTVSGESVRVLMAYAKARIQDTVPEGGWLTRAEAYALWVELGGHSTSPTERIGWEKGKLRERLERAGAINVGALFENRRQHGIITSRLSVSPCRIHINNLA